MKEKMYTLNVDLVGREYPIYIGQDLLTLPKLLQQHIRSKQIMIVSNETVAALYLEKINAAFANYQCDHLILPDGEKYKDTHHWSLILNALAEKQHHRDTTVVTLGGGVIGDMAGFAAASYQRGVAFIQIPTTLLSQVDASIGGKTAINHPLGKNFIGAFYQPQAVIIDINTLHTLPKREFSAGLAEIVKAALIKDAEFFYWLENNLEKIIDLEPEAVSYAILQACTIKKDIVVIDETEQNLRALLNLGHTFAHAIERELGFGQWLHGEAVAVGLLLAAQLSVQLHWLKPAEFTRIYQLIKRCSLPTLLPKTLKHAKLLPAMLMDKKVKDNHIRLVLSTGIGSAVITNQVTLSQLEGFLAKMD